MKDGATDSEVHKDGFYTVHREIPSTGEGEIYYEITGDSGNLVERPASCFRIMERKKA